jgi:hypothetical protein
LVLTQAERHQWFHHEVRIIRAAPPDAVVALAGQDGWLASARMGESSDRAGIDQPLPLCQLAVTNVLASRPLPNWAASARCKGIGNVRPRFAARRRIPDAAREESEYLGDTVF